MSISNLDNEKGGYWCFSVVMSISIAPAFTKSSEQESGVHRT
jgi:hypothetical protein